MVQEYERAVIFRLGRLRQGGAKGPGEFFIFIHWIFLSFEFKVFSLSCLALITTRKWIWELSGIFFTLTISMICQLSFSFLYPFVSFDVPPQEILSRDSVTVTVDAVIYYRVFNPIMATNNVEDYRHSTHLLGATTLRNVLGTKYLAEILSERFVSSIVTNILDSVSRKWLLFNSLIININLL